VDNNGTLISKFRTETDATSGAACGGGVESAKASERADEHGRYMTPSSTKDA
jgi:hypothetical protein